MVAHSQVPFLESKDSMSSSEYDDNEPSAVRRKNNNEEKVSSQNTPVNLQKKENDGPQESCLNIKHNGVVILRLGQYKAIKNPILVLILSMICGLVCFRSIDVDPRVAHLPLMGSQIPLISITVLYICFAIVWGPRWMEHRKPINTRKAMLLYNFIQVVLCSYMFIEVGTVAWFFDYDYTCQAVDFTSDDKPLRLTRVAYLFGLSKILDLTDTVFFVLNKKFSHISILHTVHHSSMVYSTLIAVSYLPGGHGTFLGFFNSGVHVLMYSYYLLAAMGPAVRPYLWWKKYLTTIQLLQFVVVFLHSLQILFNGCTQVPKVTSLWICMYACIYFGLFMDFYRKAYQPKKGEEVSQTKNSKPIRNQLIPGTPLTPSLILDSISCIGEMPRASISR